MCPWLFVVVRSLAPVSQAQDILGEPPMSYRQDAGGVRPHGTYEVLHDLF